MDRVVVDRVGDKIEVIECFAHLGEVRKEENMAAVGSVGAVAAAAVVVVVVGEDVGKND